MASIERLRYPPGSAVLVAGLPGAGKSTFLMRLYGLRGNETQPVDVDGTLVIDSQQSRNWWARYLRGLPPRARTPLTQVTHISRIAWALLRRRCVVAHTRGTWRHVLYGLAALAKVRGNDLHLILLDVDPRIARDGQYSRGRVVTESTFARHCRRWRATIVRARTGVVPPATSVTVLDRMAADTVKAIDFDG